MQSFRSFEDWDIIKPLGEGGFGEVHQWKHRVTGKEIATKSLKPNAKLRPDEIVIFKKRWIQEFNWMQSLKIDYIVGAINLEDKDFLAYLQDQNYWKTLPVIVMEYCNGGDLRSRLERPEHVNGLPEQEIRDILRTLRHAVEYLHMECNIEHRDIKPENIVIHCSGNIKNYKLTDFGYARDIPENTIAQSVVGTRHYVAPEVIEPGCYTKTVDYWSVGVMTFEIICGIRPFIPHKDFRVILTNILTKPKKCIAITQAIEQTQTDDFVNEEKLFRQNNCSPIFISKIENWLSLAVDRDYKTRGSEGGVFKFYTDLDAILATDILTVFSLTSHEFHYYDTKAFNNIAEFFEKLSSDCNIKQQNIYLTLPTLHPMKTLSNIRVPKDFFVPEWSDTSNPDNPSVMLYVADITCKQCDFNPYRARRFNSVSKTIEKCINMDTKKFDKVPIWLLEQFERHVHNLLSNEQRYLKCYLQGLYDFIITIEDEVFSYEKNIDNVFAATIHLSGRVKQFQCMANEYAKLEGQQKNGQICLEKAKTYMNGCLLLKNDVVSKITTRYKSVLRHCKELAANDIYKALPKEDVYRVNEFRRFLVEGRACMKNSQRMYECLRSFDVWTGMLSKYPPRELINIHEGIAVQYELFRKIQTNIVDFEKYMLDLETRLDMETGSLIQTFPQTPQTDQLSLKMDTLCIDGNTPSLPSSLSSSITLMNGDCQQNGKSANTLCEESHNIMDSIKTVLGFEEDTAMCVDDNIPTTIKDI